MNTRLNLWSLAACAWVLSFSANADVEVRFDNPGLNFNLSITRCAAGKVTQEYHPPDGLNGYGRWDQASANLADLDLQKSTPRTADVWMGNYAEVVLHCRSGNCFSGRVGYISNGRPMSREGQGDVLHVPCHDLGACRAFLEGLMREQSNLQSRDTQTASQAHPARAETPPPPAQLTQPSPASPPPPPRIPSNEATNRLRAQREKPREQTDSLVRWVKQQPAPRKRRGRLLYAGFSQASGFHPDGTWGVGIHTDMTVAYSIAITECESRTSESCASAGYCLMQPGKYSAWASDGRSPGSSGYACNYATEAEARYTAALWCSGQCRLLWSGGNPEAAP